MNRRSFLASLVAVPAGLVAAAKGSVAAPLPLNLDEIVDQLYAIKRNRETLVMPWLQTTRTTNVASLDYLDALDEAFGLPESERRANYISRRIERSRRNIAMMKKQRPLPLP